MRPQKIISSRYSVLNNNLPKQPKTAESEDFMNPNAISGNEKMPWLEAYGSLNGKSVKILRIRRPERMKKSEYVSAVAEWIEKGNIPPHAFKQ